METPGVTAPDANAPLGPTEEGRDSALGAEEAIQPPSEAVRLEMRKMELEAEIANAGGALMNSTGDDSILVGQPSREAIEALKAGLLDETAPTTETDPTEHSAQ